MPEKVESHMRAYPAAILGLSMASALSIYWSAELYAQRTGLSWDLSWSTAGEASFPAFLSLLLWVGAKRKQMRIAGVAVSTLLLLWCSNLILVVLYSLPGGGDMVLGPELNIAITFFVVLVLSTIGLIAALMAMSRRHNKPLQPDARKPSRG